MIRRGSWGGWLIAIAAASVLGCSTVDRDLPTSGSHLVRAPHVPDSPPDPPQDASLQRASADQHPEINHVKLLTAPNEFPFAHASELSVDELVEQVLARNPSLAEMTAAWEAASARVPQVTSLDDPMLAASVGPGSIGSSSVDFGYKLQLSQKLPFPGKLGLKGDQAFADAAAAGNEVEAVRLQLIEAAKSALYDFYLVDRALEVNEENLKRLKEAKQNAEARYKNNLAPQQDVLQADVELARQQKRDIVLRRIRQVAQAKINTLLHVLPDTPLPPPPKRLQLAKALPGVPQLRANALSRHPELQAAANLLAADQAALGLAYRDYYPDFEVMAGYDAFWQEEPLRLMVGVGINLPIQRTRRSASVAEASARIAQRRAQLDRLTDQVNYQVHEAYEQLQESEKVVRLYEKTILPAAEANEKEALAAYTTGKIPFLSLIEAQRRLIEERDQYYVSLADYFRRLAALERVVGGLPP